jgi:hypothetical protein
MIEEFALATPPLLRLAKMVRAADTGQLDLSPEAAGLLAASLGLSRNVMTTISNNSRQVSRSAMRSTGVPRRHRRNP